MQATEGKGGTYIYAFYFTNRSRNQVPVSPSVVVSPDVLMSGERTSVSVKLGFNFVAPDQCNPV